MPKPHYQVFDIKRRKAIPHEFVLEALSALSPRTRPMFGCLAVYVGDRIVLALRDKPSGPADNGVWLATSVEHHESLRREFPNMRSIQAFGKEVTGWQTLPSEAPDFEEAALRACQLIAARDPRIGKVPGAKRAKRFQLQPRLTGDLLELRPLRPSHRVALFAVASDPAIWEQHPARDRYREEVFAEFFQEALESRGALIAIDKATGEIVGSSRYFGYDPGKRSIEIGWTFLARSHWGGKYNGEMKRLMLHHAFRFVDSVIFLVGPENIRSRRAVEKIGGERIGTREAVLHGKAIEHVVYEMKKSRFRY